MFLGVHACAEEVIAIIDQMNAATIPHADAIYGDQIAAVNAWDCFKNGAKQPYCGNAIEKSTIQSLSNHMPITQAHHPS